MTDRLTDEILDHLIETHRGTLANANKKGQVYAPVKNLEQTIKGLEEAKEKRAEAKFRQDAIGLLDGWIKEYGCGGTLDEPPSPISLKELVQTVFCNSGAPTYAGDV